MAKRKRAHAPDLGPVHPTLVPRNKNQQKFMSSIMNNTVTFGMGSAGSGKTYIAAMLAAEALQKQEIRKIIICRPIIEAGGEQLGFLPGNLNEKCEPYLKPMFDVFQMFWYRSIGQFENYLKREVIEVCPLAFMRGRNFENCWIICDEAQNMNDDSMKMLLTRVAQGSKLIITGDPDQRDRRDARGFETAVERLSDCPDVGFVTFNTNDVERSQLVKDVLKRWR